MLPDLDSAFCLETVCVDCRPLGRYQDLRDNCAQMLLAAPCGTCRNATEYGGSACLSAQLSPPLCILSATRSPKWKSWITFGNQSAHTLATAGVASFTWPGLSRRTVRGQSPANTMGLNPRRSVSCSPRSAQGRSKSDWMRPDLWTRLCADEHGVRRSAEMPDQIPPELPERIRREAAARGITLPV